MERRKYLFAFIFGAAYFGFMIYFCYYKLDFFKNLHFDFKDMTLTMNQLFVAGSALMVVGALLAALIPGLRFIIFIGLIAQVVGQSYLVFKFPDFFLLFHQEGVMNSIITNPVIVKVLSYVFIGTVYLMQLTIFLSLLHTLRTIILPLLTLILSMIEIVFVLVAFAKTYGSLNFSDAMQMLWLHLQTMPLILLLYPFFTFFFGLASDGYHAKKAQELPRY